MKITSIQSTKIYDKLELIDETIELRFSSSDENLQSKALYYLICAVYKMENKEYSELDLIAKMQTDNRIDAAIEYLNEMRK